MYTNPPQKIVIFGQYKSGTTALLFKIRNSLPKNTRMLLEPQAYIPKRNDSKIFVLAKVIAGISDGKEIADYKSFMHFDKKIYLVRDPRDWIVSGILFILQQETAIYNNDNNVRKIIKILEKKEEDPKSISVVKLLEHIISLIPGQSIEEVRRWMIDQYCWLFEFERRLDNYCTIKYEDFVDDKLTEVERYLGIELAGAAEVDDQNRHVVRTKSYGDWRNWYTEKDIDFFRPIFRKYMDNFGYEDDWKLNEEQVIKPEFCSEYVEKTIIMRREKDRQTENNKNYLNRAKRLIGRILQMD